MGGGGVFDFGFLVFDLGGGEWAWCWPSPPGPSCKLDSASLHAELPVAGMINPAAGAGGSSLPSGARPASVRRLQLEREPDRRQSCVVNPNGCQSRRSSRRPSSFSQEWDPRMLRAIKTWVGIDLAKKSFDVAGLAGRSVRSLPNTSAGHQQLIKQLPAPGTCLIVVESTGGYERALVAAFAMAGHLVAVGNPRQVRDFARSQGILAKTDRIDALVIARFGEVTQPLPQVYEEDQAYLQALIARRRQLVEHRAAELNRRQQTGFADVAKSVQLSIDAAGKEIKRLDKKILALVQSHDDWRERFERAPTGPGG